MLQCSQLTAISLLCLVTGVLSGWWDCPKKVIMYNHDYNCAGDTVQCTGVTQGYSFDTSYNPVLKIKSTSWTQNAGEEGAKCRLDCEKENFDVTITCIKKGNVFEWSELEWTNWNY
eukprot:GFUD01110241.1.p1 GENE.GFUD01110241.1~~GFUD01110241.1.p1  ORF type:complete len:134 (-),score=20.41 GFUD01110241.1:100-447(-)